MSLQATLCDEHDDREVQWQLLKDQSCADEISQAECLVYSGKG